MRDLTWRDVCQMCMKQSETTRTRTEIYTKNFMGPCADSFCYASCDSEMCRPITATICDKCYKEISRKK